MLLISLSLTLVESGLEIISAIDVNLMDFLLKAIIEYIKDVKKFDNYYCRTIIILILQKLGFCESESRYMLHSLPLE